MIAFATNLLLVSGVVAGVVDLPNERNNARATTSYLARMADTWVTRGTEKDFGYTSAVLYRGFELAIDLTQNETLVDWYEGQMSIVQDDGTIATDSENYNYTFYSLDEYRFGISLLYWYNRTGEEKYKLAADKIREMFHHHPRNAEGGFWHRSPTYPNQMWGDGIFMADTFYAKYTSLFDTGNTTAWDDITLQYELLETHCTNATSKLLKHGYDGGKAAVWADPVTGASPLVWDRADGWYFVSLTETIQLLPKSHEGYGKLVGYFQSLAEGLLNAQDSSGGWWLIMDKQYRGAKGNYIESSASAMFAYGFFVGVRLGLLDEATYLAAAKKAYELLVEKFVVESSDGLNWEGTVSVGSLNSNASFEVRLQILHLHPSSRGFN